MFVSELGETTQLFAEQPIEVALSRAYSGGVVPVTHNSNYGRMLHAFEDPVLADVNRRTTPWSSSAMAAELPGRRGRRSSTQSNARARAVVLCPEPRAAWATGDSAMPRYAPKCTRVLEVRSARDLETAARLLLALR